MVHTSIQRDTRSWKAHTRCKARMQTRAAMATTSDVVVLREWLSLRGRLAHRRLRELWAAGRTVRQIPKLKTQVANSLPISFCHSTAQCGVIRLSAPCTVEPACSSSVSGVLELDEVWGYGRPGPGGCLTAAALSRQCSHCRGHRSDRTGQATASYVRVYDRMDVLFMHAPFARRVHVPTCYVHATQPAHAMAAWLSPFSTPLRMK